MTLQRRKVGSHAPKQFLKETFFIYFRPLTIETSVFPELRLTGYRLRKAVQPGACPTVCILPTLWRTSRNHDIMHEVRRQSFEAASRGKSPQCRRQDCLGGFGR